MSILAWIEDQKRLKLINAPKYVNPASDSSRGLWTRCDKCGVILYIKHLKENLRVCFGCSYHLQMSSQERVESLLDKDSWRPLDETVSPCDPLEFHDQKDYTDRLQEAQERTGLQDAIQTGSGMVDGIPIALGVMDFEFMGGSMGSVVGEKVTRLIEYATQEGLTLVLVCASGGARMQEGVFSLMQMAKISSALQVYQTCANLLYISIVTSPTTGGVTASFAMLGDIIFAEPKALIAFAGRRVIEQTLCEDLPEDFQTSEYMLHHGLLDLIVPRRFLRQALSESIRLYRNAPFQRPGRIPFGVQNPITFLVEERIRRRWKKIDKSLATLKRGTLPPLTNKENVNVSDGMSLPATPSSTKKASNFPSLSSHSSARIKEAQPDSVKSGRFLQKNEEKFKNKENTYLTEDQTKLIDTDAVITSLDDQPDSLIRRESGEYRNILTSFQTMFYLFLKESVVPYTDFQDAKNSQGKKDAGFLLTEDSQNKNVQSEIFPTEKTILSGVNSPLEEEIATTTNTNQLDVPFDVLLSNFMTLSKRAFRNHGALNGENSLENKLKNENSSRMDTLKESSSFRVQPGTTSNGTRDFQSSSKEKALSASKLDTDFNSNSSSDTGTDIDTASTCIDFLNQSIELAATEGVQWRAFYVHQKISQDTGFLEDLLRSSPKQQSSKEAWNVSLQETSLQNMLFYRSICRTSS